MSFDLIKSVSVERINVYFKENTSTNLNRTKNKNKKNLRH